MVSRTLEHLDDSTLKNLSNGTPTKTRAGRGSPSPTKEERPRARDVAELKDYVGFNDENTCWLILIYDRNSNLGTVWGKGPSARFTGL